MNQIDATGLQVDTPADIIADFTPLMQAIYGSDINLAQNSPDGQMLNIMAQAIGDMLQLVLATHASFSPDQASGADLDARLALNGLARNPGSYTMQPIAVTVDRALTLQGLDADIANPDGVGYTVADEAGTQFILAATYAFAAPGTQTLVFRAKDIGQVETTPNTITNPVTIVLGVTAINNPAVANSVGTDEESDADFRARHARSFQLPAVGPADAIEATLLALPAVTDAFVPENTTGALTNGIAAHSIWPIVEGGTDADVAAAIYRKKAPGCGLVGGTTVNVVRPNGTTIAIQFDRPITQRLWIHLSLLPVSPGISFDPMVLGPKLAAALVYKLNQSPTIGDVVRAMFTIEPRAICTALGVSRDNANFFDLVSPTDYQHKFTVASGDIVFS